MGTGYSIFFVFLQVFGKYVLLNLFLAILLENFDEDGLPEEKWSTLTDSEMKNKSVIIRFINKIRGIFKSKNKNKVDPNSCSGMQVDNASFKSLN